MSQWQPSWSSSYPKNNLSQDPLYTYGMPGKLSRPSFSNEENPTPNRQPLYLPNPLSQPNSAQPLENQQEGLSSSPYQYMQYPLQQPPVMGPAFQNNLNPNFNNNQEFHGEWDPSISSADRNGLVASRDSKDSSHSRSSVDQSSSETSRSLSDQAKPRSASGGVTKRSRMGCLTCRQRKKRCCETRPKCSECLRLRLNCVWPKPGTEHKNKSKEVKSQENTIDHDVYGKIKVLRGIVEYRSS